MSERQSSMISECRQVEDNLIDYVEGKVSLSLQSAIGRHLKSCLECARLVEKFSVVWEAIPERERFTPSESLWPELLDKIRSLEESAFSGEKLIIGLQNPLRFTAAVLLLLFSLGFGYHLGNFPERYPAGEQFAVPDPDIAEEIFVSEYFQDFQDFPPGTISDAYTSYEIQDPDKES